MFFWSSSRLHFANTSSSVNGVDATGDGDGGGGGGAGGGVGTGVCCTTAGGAGVGVATTGGCFLPHATASESAPTASTQEVILTESRYINILLVRCLAELTNPRQMCQRALP